MGMSSDSSRDMRIFTGENQPQPQKQQQNQGAANTPGKDWGMAAGARQRLPQEDARRRRGPGACARA